MCAHKQDIRLQKLCVLADTESFTVSAILAGECVCLYVSLVVLMILSTFSYAFWHLGYYETC